VGWDALTASDEMKVADWIRDRLHPFGHDVGSIVPAGVWDLADLRATLLGLCN
jgi:hypothetical protein